MSSQNRREFVKQIGLIVAAAPCALVFGRALGSSAYAADAKKLPAGAISENDPVAKAVGYKHDVKDVDPKKRPLPARKNEFCKNCALYTASDAGWGKCTMLTGGLVAAKGWCGSWSKKS